MKVGEQVRYFLVKLKQSTRYRSNGKPFLTVILQDPNVDIEAKLWDVLTRKLRNNM